MVAEIGDPTRVTGTGAGETIKGNQRDSTMGMAQDLVADKVVTLVEETVITAEAPVHERAMVQTPTPPTKTGRKLGAVVRAVGKEVVRRRNNDGLGIGKRYS